MMITSNVVISRIKPKEAVLVNVEPVSIINGKKNARNTKTSENGDFWRGNGGI